MSRHQELFYNFSERANNYKSPEPRVQKLMSNRDISTLFSSKNIGINLRVYYIESIERQQKSHRKYKPDLHSAKITFNLK